MLFIGTLTAYVLRVNINIAIIDMLDVPKNICTNSLSRYDILLFCHVLLYILKVFSVTDMFISMETQDSVGANMKKEWFWVPFSMGTLFS